MLSSRTTCVFYVSVWWMYNRYNNDLVIHSLWQTLTSARARRVWTEVPVRTEWTSIDATVLKGTREWAVRPVRTYSLTLLAALSNTRQHDFLLEIPYKNIAFKYHWFLYGAWMVLGGIMANAIWMVSEWFFEWYFEWYFGFFVPFSGIEWYFKLLLRVPLSPADISLILNGIQW